MEEMMICFEDTLTICNFNKDYKNIYEDTKSQMIYIYNICINYFDEENVISFLRTIMYEKTCHSCQDNYFHDLNIEYEDVFSPNYNMILKEVMKLDSLFGEIIELYKLYIASVRLINPNQLPIILKRCLYALSVSTLCNYHSHTRS